MIANKNASVILSAALLLSFTAAAQMDKTIDAYALSLQHEAKKDYFGAIRSIMTLKDSTTYENNLRLGWLYYRAGQEKKSLHYYKRAVDLMPSAIEPRIGFGYPAYLLESFDELIAQDKKVLEIDPNNKIINSNLAQIYYYDRQFSKALPHFQKVVQQYPFDYDNNLLLGWTYLRLGNNAEAEKCFNIALLYSPGDPSAKEGMESIGKSGAGTLPVIPMFAASYEFASNSDNKNAAAELQKIYDRKSYFINLRLGWLMFQAGLHNESLNYYKIAMEIMPGSVEAKLGALLPLEAMGNVSEQKALCETILGIDPQNTTVLYKLGYIHYQKKDYDKALPFFEKLVKLYPFSYDGLFMYGWTHYQLGKLTESREIFYKVLCLSPGNQSVMQALRLKQAGEAEKPGEKEIIRPR